MAEAENLQIQQICRSAFEAEHLREFRKASDLHSQAIQRLTKLVDESKLFDSEKKRIARKQIKFHSGRRQLLAPILSGQKDGQQLLILPTGMSALESVFGSDNAQRTLSADELALFQWEQTKEKNRNISPAPPAIPSPLQNPVPFYTPTLPEKLPETCYSIHSSTEGGFLKGGIFMYSKVKDAAETQTLYVLQTFKKNRYQIPSTSFHRASEFTSPCIVTIVTPILNGYDKHSDSMKGRPLKHHMSVGPIIDVTPDRKESHAKWTPRRFTYGGRRFVWKPDVRDWKQGTAEALYEVEKEWPQAGSKTGKRDDKTLGKKLVWIELKTGLKKVAVVHFAAGMDQLFHELILASWLTREVVMIATIMG